MDSFLVIIGELMSALGSKHIATCVDYVVVSPRNWRTLMTMHKDELLIDKHTH